MLVWILIIGGLLVLAGFAWRRAGQAPSGVDSEAVRNAKRDNNARGDHFGGF